MAMADRSVVFGSVSLDLAPGQAGGGRARLPVRPLHPRLTKFAALLDITHVHCVPQLLVGARAC